MVEKKRDFVFGCRFFYGRLLSIKTPTIAIATIIATTPATSPIKSVLVDGSEETVVVEDAPVGAISVDTPVSAHEPQYDSLPSNVAVTL